MIAQRCTFFQRGCTFLGESNKWNGIKPVEFIRARSVLHADKKRTIPLLRSIGFKMPIALLRDGSVGSIFYSGTNVNIHGVPFGEVISENEKLFDDVGVSYDAETESASPARFSLKTWNSSGYVTKREEEAKSLADAMNISQKKAKQYIRKAVPSTGRRKLTNYGARGKRTADVAS